MEVPAETTVMTIEEFVTKSLTVSHRVAKIIIRAFRIYHSTEVVTRHKIKLFPIR